jgi:hypothetical protein
MVMMSNWPPLGGDVGRHALAQNVFFQRDPLDGVPVFSVKSSV